jgi:hypothetical protein
MKPIKITKSNSEKIQSAIEAVQSRAKIRIISLDHIFARIEYIENYLAHLLYKKDWIDLVFSVDENAKGFPNSYNGAPESTQYKIKRKSTGWFLEEVVRTFCREKRIKTDLTKKSQELSEFVSRFYF